MRGAIAALTLVTGAALAGCAPATASNDPASASGTATSALVQTMSAQELAALIRAGNAVLIDVRTPAEFAESRLPGSLNAPLGTFDPASIPVEAERETILYCGSSRRSGIAAAQLSEYLGAPVRHLEGGIKAWSDAGLETISSQND